MMKKHLLIIAFLSAALAVSAQDSPEAAPVRVSGKVNVGLSTRINTDQDSIDFVYSADDPRLGTGSGHRYVSNVDDVSRNLQANYGAELELLLHPQHTLALSLEGAHDYERAMGTRTERILDKEGKTLSAISGSFNHPKELTHDLAAGLDYTYRLRRPGSQLHIGYHYRWENENAGVEQHMNEALGWSLFTNNMLEQKITYQTHQAHLDYTLPVAKGHLLDFGLAYHRRLLTVHSEQEWDEKLILESDYRHLTQYGGLHARYRLKLGPVEAMARLEYRATRMQNRWLHDVLPTATIKYQVDSIHSLSAFYTIMLIRPEAQHLDTNRIVGPFTQRFGSDRIVGVHVHNVALTYRMSLEKVSCAAEVRYLTANDGFNAIWMERADTRIYTWGNEGVRHAVGLTPSVDSHLSPTTELHFSATVMWDKRIAEAIHLANANWGLRSNLRLMQQLAAWKGSSTLHLLMRGDYAYHNTLDVYSYAGHGGSVGADLQCHLPIRETALNLSLGYTCLFKPDIYIIQGAYTGTLIYSPGATHIAAIHLTYSF